MTIKQQTVGKKVNFLKFFEDKKVKILLIKNLKLIFKMKHTNY